jgi:hypothetical protein
VRRCGAVHGSAYGGIGKFSLGEWPAEPTLSFYVEHEAKRDVLCRVEACPERGIGYNEEGDKVFLRCESCPLYKLDALSEGPFGELLRAAVEIRETIEAGVTVGISDVPADELICLRILEKLYPSGKQHHHIGGPGGYGRGEPADRIGQ